MLCRYEQKRQTQQKRVMSQTRQRREKQHQHNAFRQATPTESWQRERSVAMLAPLGLALLLVAVVASCARMGQPDGGWYDETPPKVIGATPADRGVNVSAKKVNIFFDEYIKIENPSEKVVVSPPQLEQPEIKAAGKRIEVKLAEDRKSVV